MTSFEIYINGNTVSVDEGTTAAAAILAEGCTSFRNSVSGEPRAALCGMGICYECRVTIDGLSQQKSCQINVVAGMNIKTDGSD